jgi:hypothetical protein
MSARDLAACLSVLLAMGAVLISAITVVPELESSRSVLVVVLLSAAGILGLTAVALRGLPREHWCCQPHRVHAAVALVALIMALLLLG